MCLTRQVGPCSWRMWEGNLEPYFLQEFDEQILAYETCAIVLLAYVSDSQLVQVNVPRN